MAPVYLIDSTPSLEILQKFSALLHVRGWKSKYFSVEVFLVTFFVDTIAFMKGKFSETTLF